MSFARDSVDRTPHLKTFPRCLWTDNKTIGENKTTTTKLVHEFVVDVVNYIIDKSYDDDHFDNNQIVYIYIFLFCFLLFHSNHGDTMFEDEDEDDEDGFLPGYDM
jgi:hypothetical protein